MGGPTKQLLYLKQRRYGGSAKVGGSRSAETGKRGGVGEFRACASGVPEINHWECREGAGLIAVPRCAPRFRHRSSLAEAPVVTDVEKSGERCVQQTNGMGKRGEGNRKMEEWSEKKGNG